MTCSYQTDIRIFHCDLHPDVNFNIWINRRKVNLIYCQLKWIKALRNKSKLKQHIVALFPQTQLHTLNPQLLCLPSSKAAQGKEEYGNCRQSVTAPFCCSIMVLSTGCSPSAETCSGLAPRHGLQFLQKNLHLLWHVILCGLQGTHLLWHLKQFLPFLLLWPWCWEGCFTFFLTPLCHAAFSLSCRPLPRGGPASLICSAVSCVHCRAAWNQLCLHRATHTRAPELNTEAQTQSWTLRTSWPSPVLSFKLCPKSHLWDTGGQTHRLIWTHSNNFVLTRCWCTKCKTLLSSAQFCICADLCGGAGAGAEPVGGASSEDFWSERGSGAHPSISHSLSKMQYHLTFQSCKKSNSSTIKQKGNPKTWVTEDWEIFLNVRFVSALLWVWERGNRRKAEK